MTCELDVKDLLKNAMRAEMNANPLTRGLEENVVHPADNAQLQVLDAIGLKYGGSTLYRVLPGATEIEILITVDQRAIDSYTKTDPGQTAWQRANSNPSNNIDIEKVAEDFHQSIGSNMKKLDKFVESVLLAAREISRKTQNSEVFEALSEVRASILSDPNYETKMRVVSQFLSEAHAFLTMKVPEMQAQLREFESGDEMREDAAYIQMVATMETLKLYERTLDDFREFVSRNPKDNPLSKLVGEAWDAKKSINEMWGQASAKIGLTTLTKTLDGKNEKLIAQIETEIAKKEAAKVGANRARTLRLERDIIQLRKDLEKYAPSAQNLEDKLTGEAPDSTWINKMILAGTMNPDLLIQGFMRVIKDSLQKAQQKFFQIGNDIGREYQKLLDSGFSDGNIDKAFSELYETVEESFYNEETGEIETINQLYFEGDTSNQWRTEFTKLKADLTKLGRDIQAYRKLEGTAEYNKVVFDKMEADYDTKKTEYIDWRRNNFESEYDDRYQAVDRILDTLVTFKGSTISLREIRKSFYDNISAIQQQVQALTGVPSDTEIEEMNRYRNEFEALKSMEGKTPGTEEYRMAELFTQYQQGMKEMTDRWDISPSALDQFHARKAKIDKRYEVGEITKEERDRWYVANTTTVYSNDYWSRRRSVVEGLNNIAAELFRITGQEAPVDLKESYERLESISRKYRDHNSHIAGQKLTAEEVDATREIEEAIEDVKRKTKAAYSGFLGAEFAEYYKEISDERDSLVRENARLRREDPSNSDHTKALIATNRARLTQLRGNETAFVAKFLAERGMPKEDIKSFQNLYNQYRLAIIELSDLTESVETDAYYETFQNELNKFVAGKSQAERDAKVASTNSVTIGKVKYRKGPDGEFHEVNFDGTLADEVTDAREIIDQLFKKEFENTPWYKANHFEAERYDKNSKEMATKMVPIYSWRISKPRNSKYIKEAAPNISWKRRVIKDEFRNSNRKTEADGLPSIKQGLHTNTAIAGKRAASPALWEFRDYMIDGYLRSQEEYPEGQRMGMRVPSIERDESFYDLAQNRGLKRAGKQVGRKFKFTAQDKDEGLYRAADEAGRERKFIPTLYRGKLEAELVSRNIVETIGKYMGQAEVYKARTELAKLGDALETTLSHQNHVPTSTVFNKMANAMGIKKRMKKNGPNQRLDTIREMTNMFIYGQTVAEETERGKLLHKWISNLLGIRAAMLFSELPNIIKSVTGDNMIIGNTGLSQLVNLFGGEIQQIIKTAIKSGVAKFSLSDWAWAKGQYTANSTRFVQDVGKITNKSYWTQFAEFFDAQEMSYIDNFGEQLYSKGFLRKMTLNNLAFFKNVVEHELFMTTVMAFAKNHHITTTDGRTIALSSAFEIQGGQLRPKDGVELSDQQMADIRGNIASLLRDINGNYAKMDRTLADNHWIGKSIFFMKKWLVPMVVTRYGGKKYSVEQDRIVQGYIRETASLFSKGVGDLARGARQGELDGAGLAGIFIPSVNPDFTDAQRDAIRRTWVELTLLSLMYLTYKFVLGYDQDDPERFQKLKKERYHTQVLVYALAKATSEQSTFIPPFGINEVNKVRKNLLTNTTPFLSEGWEIIARDIEWDLDPTTKFFKEYKRDTGLNKKGDMKAAAHLWKMAGLTNAKQDPIEALRAMESSLNR